MSGNAVAARVGRLVLLLAALAVTVWFVLRVRGLLTSFATAFAIAYVLNPAVNGLERLYARMLGRMRVLSARGLAVGTLSIAVILAVVAVAVFVVPTVYQQMSRRCARASSLRSWASTCAIRPPTKRSGGAWRRPFATTCRRSWRRSHT